MDLTNLVGLDERAVRCPYAEYGQARDEGVAYDPAVGAYVVARHADAVAVLRDGATFSSDEVLGRRLPPAEDDDSNQAPLLLVTDDPIHSERRAFVSRAFTPRQVRAWEPLVTGLCGTLADRMVALPDPDFVRDFAAPLPIRVITAVLGVPSDEADTFRRWSEEVTRSLGSHDVRPAERQAAARNFRSLVWDLLDHAESLEETSILSAIAATERTGRLNRYEAARLVMELIVAGNITTTDHLANSAMLLATDPDLVSRLRADRSLIPAFVEESLRLEAPVQGFYRRATRDTTVGGVLIPADARLFVLYAAANRDPDRYDGPDDLRLEREAVAGHIAFGFGTHTCVGAPLARLEGRIALEVLLERVEGIELADTGQVEYLPSYINHGPTRLPLRFTGVTGAVSKVPVHG